MCARCSLLIKVPKFPVETRPMSSRCFFWRRGMERIFRVVCRIIQSQDCLTYQCLSLVAFDVRFTCVTSAAVRMLQLCFERHARGMHAAPCGPRDCYLRRTYRISFFSKLAGFNSTVYIYSTYKYVYIAVYICRSADVPMLTICDCTHIIYIYMLCVHDAFWIELNLKLTCLFTLLDIFRHYMDIIAKTRNKTPSLPLFQQVIHVISGDCWSEQTGTNFMNLPTVRPSRHPPTLSHVTFQTSREVSPKISVVDWISRYFVFKVWQHSRNSHIITLRHLRLSWQRWRPLLSCLMFVDE